MELMPKIHGSPIAGTFKEDGSLTGGELETLQIGKQKSKVTCIIGSIANKDALKFAENLLRLQYHRICVLHHGIEIFRNLLVVPDT